MILPLSQKVRALNLKTNTFCAGPCCTAFISPCPNGALIFLLVAGGGWISNGTMVSVGGNPTEVSSTSRGPFLHVGRWHVGRLLLVLNHVMFHRRTDIRIGSELEPGRGRRYCWRSPLHARQERRRLREPRQNSVDQQALVVSKYCTAAVGVFSTLTCPFFPLAPRSPSTIRLQDGSLMILGGMILGGFNNVEATDNPT